jgi:hypoxanthine phosphoribosyltransferase
MMPEMLVFSWSEMDGLHRKVASLVKEAAFTPDVIVGIVRCGLVSATHLAYLLGVRVVGGVYVRTTPTDEVLVSKDCEPETLLLTPPSCLTDRRVIVVDTVMASGTSITLACQLISECRPAEVKTAVIVDWPNSPYATKHGKRPTPDFVGTSVIMWPDFPWEH